jgi:hypothetical protein
MKDNDRFQFCCSRKNLFEPVMELVTALLVPTMTGAVETVVQTVGGGLQRKTGGIGRPQQNDLGPGTHRGQ